MWSLCRDRSVFCGLSAHDRWATAQHSAFRRSRASFVALWGLLTPPASRPAAPPVYALLSCSGWMRMLSPHKHGGYLGFRRRSLGGAARKAAGDGYGNLVRNLRFLLVDGKTIAAIESTLACLAANVPGQVVRLPRGRRRLLLCYSAPSSLFVSAL